MLPEVLHTGEWLGGEGRERKRVEGRGRKGEKLRRGDETEGGVKRGC